MPSVFISYSIRDIEVARYIARELQARGADIFLDEQDMRPGPNWEQLGPEIRNREYFVVLLSPDAARSKWVPKEIAWAFVVKKDERKIIPLIVRRLSEEDWEKIFYLIGFQSIDFSESVPDYPLEEPIARLARYLELPVELLSERPTIRPFPELEEREGAEEEVEEPYLTLDDIQQVLESAIVNIRSNPRRASYLLRQASIALSDFVQRAKHES